jgi:hypothetical protein
MKIRLLIIMLGLLLAMPDFTSANVQTPNDSEKQAEKRTVPGSQDKEEDKESEECDCENKSIVTRTGRQKWLSVNKNC